MIRHKAEKDFTTEAYDKSAEWYLHHRTYGKVADFWTKERADFLRLLNGKRVLDVGCGPGIETAHFMEKGLKVVGIDKSIGMLEQAMKRVPEGDFRKMDMLDLDFPNNSFDGIWCCASLLHLKKAVAGRAIDEFRRVTRRDGIVFISVKEGKEEAVKDYLNGTRRFFANYTAGELEAIVSANGLRTIRSYRNTSDPDGDIWLSVFARPVDGKD